MAKIYPFGPPLRHQQGLHEDVVTQPYDKITPEMQQSYYDRSKYNLIRVILGKKETADTDAFAPLPAGETAHNVYTRAESLVSWRKKGILREEAEPALYGYSQTYTVPGRRRRASVAALSRWAISTTTPKRSSIATSRPSPSINPTGLRSSKPRAPTASRSTCSTPTRPSPPNS